MGKLTVRVSGKSPERFFNLCSFHGIFLNQIKREGEYYRFVIDACDFYKAGKLSKKAQVRIRIEEKRGFIFFLRRNRKRLAFYMGILFCTGFLYGTSLFIWDIQMEGNQKYTDQTLLHFLESKGYVHGMKKAGIICEEIEKDIRNNYNDITWVSAEITGNRLIIRIKENQILEASEGMEESLSTKTDITAKRGGTIISMITRSGTPAVHVGDVVEPGQLLISGTLEITDEGGNLLKTESVKADGDIIAKTEYIYEDSFSLSAQEKYYTGEEKERNYLWLFGKRYYLPGGKNHYEFFDEIDSYSQVHLWGNFYLPFGWGLVTAREYREAECRYSAEAAKIVAENRFQAYCEDLEASGAVITESDYETNFDMDFCRVTGKILTEEAIGY